MIKNIKKQPAKPASRNAWAHRRSSHAASTQKQEKQGLKVIPFGGLEEVGRNMLALEYDDQILVVDMGFGFPDEDMPGIDYTIPNFQYLKENKHKIVGVFITHGHYDHIGAIPYVIHEIGNPTIYATPLTRGIILKRQDDFPHQPKLNIETVHKDKEETIVLGHFKVTPFHVNHNIPDSIGLAIQTPLGLVVHTCDFKFDFSPIADEPADLGRIVTLTSQGVFLLLSDSTGSEKPGQAPSEKEIFDNLGTIFEHAEGRIIAATFSSLIERVQQIIYLAERFDRKLVIEGYSMKNNVEICRSLGYLKIKKGTIILPEEALMLPPEKLVIMCTGAQGEDRAALMRITNGEHRYFKVEQGDTIIFSSSVVPGNERSVQYLTDSLARQGAKIFNYRMMDIHVSGHAYREDLKLLLNIVKPKFLMPIHGQFSMLRAHEEIAQLVGVQKENIVIASNGDIVEFTPEEGKIIGEVPANYIMVDGLGIGDVNEVVLRDRELLSKDGMFVIIAAIDAKTGKLKGVPNIISRGSIHLRESKELLDEMRGLIKRIVERTATPGYMSNWAHVKDNIREQVGSFLWKKLKRRPMVLPAIVEV
ncbi:MAG: ribonuclease J [Patescibacteria group bacterium]|nr:ribonuclease J [Patescibacteria group bacterium]MDE2438204.1 ribonuclease J [Patescibacteria group bacterium]